MSIVFILIQIAISVLILWLNYNKGKTITIINYISLGVLVLSLLATSFIFLFVKNKEKTLTYERRLKVIKLLISFVSAVLTIYYAVLAYIAVKNDEERKILNIIVLAFAVCMFLFNLIKIFVGLKKANKNRIKQEERLEKKEKKK